MRTRVGYAGGTKENPTYHNLGDHTESIQVDYNPTLVTFDKLIDVFWNSHNPTMPSFSKQYMSILFYHDEDQKRLAIASINHEASRSKRKIFTKILPLKIFYMAEDYHQKYRLRSERDLMKEFRAKYNSTEDFVNSTAAARVNGYLAGYGTLEDLMEELPGFGLSQKANKKLIEIVKSRKAKRVL